MSVLAVFSPARPDRPGTPSAVALPAPTVPMVDWTETSPGRWSGRIGLDRAGTVERVVDGYRLVDWDGTDLGEWPTLPEAQLRLEPDVRAALREAQAPRERPVASLVGTAALSTSAATLVATAAWFAVQAL